MSVDRLSDDDFERLSEVFHEPDSTAPLEEDDAETRLAHERGWVTREQLEEARLEQLVRHVSEGEKPPLSQVLADKGFLSPERLAELRREVRSSSRLPARRKIGRYQLLELLGEGGMGVVFRARDEELGREVALKMLRVADTFSPIRIQRFQREVHNAARLHHPGIVTIYDHGSEDGGFYYTMELISGKPLHRFEGDLPRRISVLEKAARAVEYAHQQGVLHRDLKPDNILVDAEGTPHILDFGLSRDLTAPSELTKSGGMLGTPMYMSPEQVEGRVREVDARSDVYALGIILYETLAGEVPYTAPTMTELARSITTDLPRRPPGPSDLVTICLKTLEKDPERRYATAGAFADDLARYLAGQPIEARPASRLYRARRWLARHRIGVGAGASVALAVAMFVSLLASGETPDEPATLGDLKGVVSVASGSTKAAAKAGQPLSAGQILETVGVESAAAVRYDDSTQVRLGADTTVHLLSASDPTAGGGRKNLLLLNGALTGEVPPQSAERPMAFVTPHARVQTGESKLELMTTPQWTRLHVMSGRARFMRLKDGAHVDVPAGHYVVAPGEPKLAAQRLHSGVPADGLVLWLRADWGVTLTESRVARWEDQSGCGNHATQSNAALQPKLAPYAINQRPGVRFDTTGAFLTLPSPLGVFEEGLSAFVVSRWAGRAPVGPFFAFQGKSGKQASFYLGSANGGMILYGGVSPGAFASVLVRMDPKQFEHLGVVEDRAGAVRLFRQGVLVRTAEPDPALLHLNAPMNTIGRSHHGNWDAHFEGDIAEILVYRRALGDAERRAVEEYFRQKFGAALKLGEETGLRAEYFRTSDFQTPVLNRLEGPVDLRPDSGAALATTNFSSARWTGSVLLPTAQEYTFTVRATGGVRLWARDRLVVDGWATESLQELTGRVNEPSGTRLPVRLEYRRNPTDVARIQLMGSGPSTPKALIPAEYLVPSPPTASPKEK